MKQKTFVVGAVTVLTLLVAAVAGSLLYIGSQAQAIAAQATREFPGDNVEALIAYLNSDTHSLQEKDRAVWSLGRLRDKRALPTLEKLYTGQPCNHDLYICQKELKKAINACKQR